MRNLWEKYYRNFNEALAAFAAAAGAGMAFHPLALREVGEVPSSPTGLEVLRMLQEGYEVALRWHKQKGGSGGTPRQIKFWTCMWPSKWTATFGTSLSRGVIRLRPNDNPGNGEGVLYLVEVEYPSNCQSVVLHDRLAAIGLVYENIADVVSDPIY